MPFNLFGQLGFTENPKDLIPGDSANIRNTIRAFCAYGHALENVGHGLKTIDDGGWQGSAADAFRSKFEQQPQRWMQAGDAFTDAAQALNSYADTLDWAQSQAREALALWKEGEAKTQQWMTADPTLSWQQRMGRDSTGDPGKELCNKAQDTLERARNQLDDAGHQAASKVGAARDLAPPAPTVLENFCSFFEGGWEAAKNTFALLDPRNWDDHAEALKKLVELALKDPEAAAKLYLDYDTLRDDPAKWAGGFLIGELLAKQRLARFERLGQHLHEHLFQGHSKPTSISGFHHRPGGTDTGGFRLDRMITERDANGVYWAYIEGPDKNGRITPKKSTLFPDHWTIAEVEDAVEQAFERRQPVRDKDGNIKPGKWQGTGSGILIEGYFDAKVDINDVKIYDLNTTYPIYQP